MSNLSSIGVSVYEILTIAVSPGSGSGRRSRVHTGHMKAPAAAAQITGAKLAASRASPSRPSRCRRRSSRPWPPSSVTSLSERSLSAHTVRATW